MLVVPQADLGDSAVTLLSPYNPGLKQQVSRIVDKPWPSSSKHTCSLSLIYDYAPNYSVTCPRTDNLVVQEGKMRRWAVVARPLAGRAQGLLKVVHCG